MRSKRVLSRLGGLASVWTLTAVTGAFAVGIYLAWTRDLPTPMASLHLPWWALAVLFLLVELCVVHLHFRRDAHSFTLNEIPLVLGLLFAGPDELLLGGLLGTAVALAAVRRRRPVKVAFNLALFALEAGLATTIFHAAQGPTQTLGLQSVSAALLAMLATTVAGVLLVFAAISLSEGSSRFQNLSQALGLGTAVTLANSSFALVAAALLWQDPQLAWLLLAPLAVLFLAYRAVVAQRREHGHLEFLHEATRLVHESIVTDEAVVSLLSQTRKKFRAELAEMIVLPEDPGQPAFRTVLGPGDRVDVMQPVDRGSIQWARKRVSAAAGAALLERAHEDQALQRHLAPLAVRDALVAPLQGEARVLGTLLVANRLGDVSTFDAEDRRLFETLGRQAGLALEKSRLEQSLAQLIELDAKLRESEAKYRTFAEQLPLVTYMSELNETSSTIYVNPQIEAVVGYSQEDCLTDRELFPKLLHPEDRERVLEEHDRAYARGESFSTEYRLLARDGRTVWVHDEVTVVHDGAGRPTHAQGFFIDITERKHAEEQLETQHHELAALHETALGLVERLDTESVLHTIAARAGALVGTEHCYLYLAEPGSDELTVRLGTGVFDGYVGYRLRRGEGLGGRVWASGEPMAVDDYHEWSGRRRDLDDRPFRAVVGVPLQSGAQVIGVLGLAYLEQGRTFGEAEIQLLSRFGHLASLALESARLYEAVRVSEERFRTLVSNVPGVIFRALSLEGRWQFEFISDAIEELSGYPAQEFLDPEHPRSLSGLVHPSDFQAVERAFEAAAREGTAYALEYRLLHRDGSIRWVLERGLGMLHPDGTRVLDSALFDITEQKLAEEERARLAAIVASSDDAIMSATLDGNIESWNRGAEELYGYSAEEALGRPISILAPPDRPDEPAELLAEIRDGERTSHHETVRTRKDGTEVDVSLTTSPIRDASGEITGASAIARDITERKRAEEALQQKTALLELLQDIADTANGSSTVEEALQACLDRVCAHTGWPVGHVYLFSEDTGDLVPTSIWHLDDAAAFESFRVVSEAIRFAPGVGLPGRALASGKPLWITDVSQDQNFPRARWAEEAGLKAGFAFPVLAGTEVAAVLEFFWTEAVEPDLQLLAVVGHIGTQLGRVVERARAEAALRQSEEHHRSIIETANDAFVAIDKRGAITDWNRRAELTFGWSREEVIGLPLAETIIPPEYRDAHEKGLARFLASGEATVLEKPLELTALHRDGREFPIELKIWPVLAEGGYRFNAFVRDVTERRSLEEQLRQSQKMEAIGTLAGGVAHDFNNLLTAIGGYSELLLAELESDDVSRKRAEEIKRAAERAASLTRQLLAFSRKQIVQPTALDVNAVMADTEKMLRRLIGEHIELVTSPAEKLARVRADRGQLEQVIVNLAVNARDAMPGGGRLTIATASVELDEVSARQYGVELGTYVELAVTDTGCGMDENVQAHVFEPFFTTKEQGKGTGLGLATVYGIVQGSGGYITVESTPGEGTTFALYLPVTQEPTELGTAPSPNGSPRGAETVLLVEDEDVVRDLVCEILRMQGYAVLAARGGEEALEICERHEGSIQVMLTDLVMPDMSGRDLAERVSSLRPDAKVIYMSGYTNDAIVHHGVRDAEVAFLQKPFTSDELAHKLREVLEGTLEAGPHASEEARPAA